MTADESTRPTTGQRAAIEKALDRLEQGDLTRAEADVAIRARMWEWIRRLETELADLRSTLTRLDLL